MIRRLNRKPDQWSQHPTYRFIPLVVISIFWSIAGGAWLLTSSLQGLLFFGYLGAAVGGGLAVYVALPPKKRPLGRRLLLFLIGSGLFVTAALRGYATSTVFQIEGLFFDLLAGILNMAVFHYLLAKLVGPLLFGRIYCGWACWTAALLDLLPYKHSKGRLPGRWGWLRYLHFALSALLVAGLWYGLAYRLSPLSALVWFLAGNALYILTGVGLAVALKDNRAFCKYVCPIAAPLKLSARLSLIKVAGDASKCNGRHECAAVCPMNIRIADYVQKGQRVLSTECILCQECVNLCPEGALTLSFGMDIGGEELLRVQGERKTKRPASPPCPAPAALLQPKA